MGSWADNIVIRFQSTDWVESSPHPQITKSRRKEVKRLITSESNTNSSVLFSIVKRRMKNSLYTQMVKVGSSESRHSFFLATFTNDFFIFPGKGDG